MLIKLIIINYLFNQLKSLITSFLKNYLQKNIQFHLMIEQKLLTKFVFQASNSKLLYCVHGNMIYK